MSVAGERKSLRPLREWKCVRDDLLERQFRTAQAAQCIIEPLFVVARADDFQFAQMQWNQIERYCLWQGAENHQSSTRTQRCQTCGRRFGGTDRENRNVH